MEFINSSSVSSTARDESSGMPPRLPLPTYDPSVPGIKILVTSDTHNKHLVLQQLFPFPEADVIIHAGDFTSTGVLGDIQGFVRWYSELPFRRKLFIAGNHEVTVDKEYYVDRGHSRFHPRLVRSDPAEYSQKCRDTLIHPNCNYLEDSATELLPIEFIKDASDASEVAKFDPIKVYGSPYSSFFLDWAFNVKRGAPSREIWDKIPTETDILITHGPAYGYGDKCENGFYSGCHDLLERVQSELKSLRLLISGHIHEVI